MSSESSWPSTVYVTGQLPDPPIKIILYPDLIHQILMDQTSEKHSTGCFSFFRDLRKLLSQIGTKLLVELSGNTYFAINMKFNFSPFPELLTDRLRLRSLTMEDTDAIFELRGHPEVKAFLPRIGPESPEAAAQKIQSIMQDLEEGKIVFWVISLRENPAVLGTICLWNLEPGNRRGELGYELHPVHHGKGYMSEALNEVLEYGFKTMHLHSICAMTDAENHSSVKLLEKANFTKEAHYREAVFYNDRFHDQVVYTKWEMPLNR